MVSDDQEISLADVVYDDPSLTAALQLPGPLSLPLGNYRLVVCATLEDDDGNLLDGNGDGSGGDDMVFGFQLDRTNLLLNPNLDADIADWSLSGAAATSFSTDDTNQNKKVADLHNHNLALKL